MPAARLLALAALLLQLALPALPAGAAGAAAELEACTPHDLEGAVQRFSRVLRFKTVSDAAAPEHVRDASEFAALDAFLRGAYASVWDALEVERLGNGSLSYLLTWRGSDPDPQPPVLFISHTDVVPVDRPEDWTHEPFSGAVADGFIWGRGALDIKCGVVGLLEGVAALLAQGYVPRRTIMLAFGHDEEVGGAAGAAQIAGVLHKRGVRFDWIWDEGGTLMMDGLPPITSQPLALVATAEKLYQTVQVSLASAGGHSSMPPIDGSSIAAKLGRLLTAMTASPPVPRLASPTRELLAGLAELAPPWIGPLLLLGTMAPNTVGRLLASAMASASNEVAALVRDTAAVTTIQAGVADNVLPQAAQLSINFRLLPGTPAAAALDYVRGWLDPRDAANATLQLVNRSGRASRVTDPRGAAFSAAKAAIQSVWRFRPRAGAPAVPVPVLPMLLPGGTDSKEYAHLTDAIVRFSPAALTLADVKRIHGTDERISLPDFARLLCTYEAALRLAGDGGAGSGAGGGGGGGAGAGVGAGGAAAS